MSKNRTEQVIDYINSHPELSGNKIYNYAKDHGFGIDKKKFYQIFRKTRNLPEPSNIKKIKSIPIKYRTKEQKKKILKKPTPKDVKLELPRKVPKKLVQKKIVKIKDLTEKDKLLTPKFRDLIEYPEDENLEYGLIEVYDKKSGESRWIKYRNKSHLDWQIDVLESSDKRKGFSSDYKFIYHGLKEYTPFFAPEFLDVIEKMES